MMARALGVRSGVTICLAISSCLIFACPGESDTDDDVTSEDDDAQPVDRDDDGYSPDDGDCDDADPAIHPGADEVCDGIDNDCDGQTDEGAPDTDGDGVYDCFDNDCFAPAVVGAHVDLISCPWIPQGLAADPWDIVVEWTYPFGENMGAGSMPAVGDLDGIDTGEGPVIAFSSTCSCSPPDGDTLTILRGDGTGVMVSGPEAYGRGNVAIADVDADHATELIVPDYGQAICLHGGGDEEWIEQDLWELHEYDLTTSVVDLDADGDPEVIYGHHVLRGGDGQLLWSMDHLGGDSGFDPSTTVSADLDLDGYTEVITGPAVYAHDGQLLWQTPYSDYWSCFPAVMDVDGDPEGEVVFSCGPWLSIYEPDGELIAVFALSDEKNGLPCAADFDGDGQVEIAIPRLWSMFVYEVDGSLRWTAPIDDGSTAAGCSAFDFDADGAYELLYADQYDFYIFDGRTGAVLFRWTEHDSATGLEYPVVADVDEDGSAEIVLACNDHSQGQVPGRDNCNQITVFGHAANEWPPAGPYWGIHDYAPLKMHPDGMVHSPTPPWWQVYNMFRGRPPGDGKPDLMPVSGGMCVASCDDDGSVEVTWGVANQGNDDVCGPISAALYALDGENTTLLDVQTIDGARYGYQDHGGTFDLLTSQVGDGLRLVIDDDGQGAGSVDECNEGNNTIEICGPICE